MMHPLRAEAGECTGAVASEAARAYCEAMGSERLAGAAAESFLAGALALARDAAVSPTWYAASVRSLEAAYTERPLMPAPTLAADLTALLHGERFAPVAPPAAPSVRDALRAYEDHVLARLTGDRRWTRLMEAVAAAPPALHAAAVGITVARVLQRLKVASGTGVSTGAVRRLIVRPIDEVLDVGRAALLRPELASRLADGLLTIAKASRRTRELLSDAEVFVIEHIAALKGLGARVALAQLAEVAQDIEERLPARRRGYGHEEGSSPTQLEEDSAYPVGGFASVSTQGSLENLVTSELAYMDVGVGEGLRPDLFDVRFVERELLYYARDESVAVRRRRALSFIFDPSLARARVLDVRESRQRLVWLLGTLIALVRRLAEWLDTEAVRFELIFVTEGAEAPLAEEEAVVGLALREYRERGQVELSRGVSTSAALLRASETHGAHGRRVLLTAGVPCEARCPAPPDVSVDLVTAEPVVRAPDAALRVSEEGDGALSAWTAATQQLLDGLLGRPMRAGAL